MELLHVQRLGGMGRENALHPPRRNGQVAAPKPLDQFGAQRRRVQLLAILRLGDVQPLALRQSVTAVHHGAAHGVGYTVTLGGEGGLIHVQLGCYIHALAPAFDEPPAAPQERRHLAAPAARLYIAPGGLRDVKGQNGHAQLGQGHAADLLPVTGQAKGHAVQQGVPLLRPQLLHLLGGHAGHVHAQHRRAGEGHMGVQYAGGHAAARVGQHQHRRDDTHDQPGLFSAGQGLFFRFSRLCQPSAGLLRRGGRFRCNRGHIGFFAHAVPPPLHRSPCIVPRFPEEWVTNPLQALTRQRDGGSWGCARSGISHCRCPAAPPAPPRPRPASAGCPAPRC